MDASHKSFGIAIGDPKRALQVALLISHPERRMDNLYTLLVRTTVLEQNPNQELIDEILRNIPYPEWKAVGFLHLAEDAFQKVQNDRALAFLAQAAQYAQKSPSNIKVRLGSSAIFSAGSIFKDIALLYAKLQRHPQANAMSQHIQNSSQRQQVQRDIQCYRLTHSPSRL
jgi:hypothetical protein